MVGTLKVCSVNDERAIVLLPALRRDAGWYVVLESAAYLWGIDHPDGDVRIAAVHHTLDQSHIACEMLGLEPSKMNRAKVISVITGWLPDLVAMPSSPPPEFSLASFGQMSMRADGKVIAGEEIKQVVTAGATYG